MINRFIQTTSICAVIVTSACSSGGDSDGNHNSSRATALFFGTTDSSTSANGLDFATATSDIRDVEGQNATVRLVRFVTDQETGATTIQVSAETFQADDLDDENYTATFGGETITFSDGIGTRGDGATVDVRRGTAGDFAQAFSIFSSVDAGGLDAGENTEGFLITGFETNPDDIAALTPSGEIIYGGTLGGSGTLIRNGGEELTNAVLLSGITTITADFANGTVSGNSDITVGIPDTVLNVDLAFEGADISGNGFSTDLTVADCTTGLTCTSDSQLAGVFYGPDAAELGGLAAIDVTGTDGDGDTIRYVGGGAIIATQ
ncbi:transferrin-binding protein-like solute binding protein [Yoonia sp. 2307UL14-13]|uniref:transferrin-binding protein-like solute binding protein n=1 Tax=Yoonia sp. 2307UL14-13 TaxID=3126506 RepID=UPI00309784A0